MQKKLKITVNKEVYEGLYEVVGRRHISQFIEDLVRPRVLAAKLAADYADLAADEESEAEANEWIEGTMGDAIQDEADDEAW